MEPTLEKNFEPILKDVRSKGLKTPVVFMMYYNYRRIIMD